jgi:3-oxoacyl-[acyl-carrier-protein] synthase II
MTRRVVVTGVGAVTPLGVGADPLHYRAVAGDSGIIDGIGHCQEFTPEEFLSRREIRRTDRFCQLALGAATEALAQAGWSDGLPYPAERVSCVIGSALGGLRTAESEVDVLRGRGADHVSSLLTAMMMGNAAAAHLAMRYSLHGESYSVAAACAAGSQAIGAGLRMVRAGEVDAVVVGGAEAATSPLVQASFRNAGVLSSSGRSVPFDRERDGLLLGEGAGVLVLEDAELAAARGAVILGEVAGYGASSDAYHLTSPDPAVTAAASAVTRALADAGVDAEDVRYINAHGTGTQLNDVTEAAALRRALGPAVERTPISSSKSCLGHLLGAAGAVEAIVALQALRLATAPPTVGLRHPDERLGELDHVVAARPLTAGPRGMSALSTSFGFGGHNAAVVLRLPDTIGTPAHA